MATRRLPVIQEPTGEDAARPPWHWVLIGAGLLVTLWTPFVIVALAIARRLAGSAVAPLLGAATFALASLAAGYLVARFGPRTRPRHAVFAGLLAALLIWLLALLGGAFTSVLPAVSALLVLSGLGAAFCALGPLLARRRVVKSVEK
jgi:4-amino-4-deoxy-L-arabinose transferase-like glycosyltransferase